jgi:hypothetical protein
VRILTVSATPNDAWLELLRLLEQGASEAAAGATPQLRWVRPNRLVFLDRWQVQARFVSEPGKYSVYLERFGAELGNFNFESTPGSGEPKRTVLTMLLELSNGEAFWRFSDGQTIKSLELARRIIDRLRRFHDEYGMSIVAPGY